MNEPLDEIEIKLAYQEKAIKDLSAAIYQQQKQIDALEKSLKTVKERLAGQAEAAQQEDILDEKPPHY